jgi:hypothetical protein
LATASVERYNMKYIRQAARRSEHSGAAREILRPGLALRGVQCLDVVVVLLELLKQTSAQTTAAVTTPPPIRNWGLA